MHSKPVLTATELDPVLAAARDRAAALGRPMAIAIVDDGGYPLRLYRMDGAGAMTGQVATAKARTAALMRAPSRVLADRVATEPALLRLTDYLPMAGGLPVKVEATCVGGIGVSGGSADEDEDVAGAGLAALTA